MFPIVFYLCGSFLPVFMNKAKCKVIFNHRALLVNEPFLMQVSVSDIKDKESTCSQAYMEQCITFYSNTE